MELRQAEPGSDNRFQLIHYLYVTLDCKAQSTILHTTLISTLFYLLERHRMNISTSDNRSRAPMTAKATQLGHNNAVVALVAYGFSMQMK